MTAPATDADQPPVQSRSNFSLGLEGGDVGHGMSPVVGSGQSGAGPGTGGGVAWLTVGSPMGRDQSGDGLWVQRRQASRGQPGATRSNDPPCETLTIGAVGSDL